MCQKRQIQQQKVDLREPKEMYSDIQLHFKFQKVPTTMTEMRKEDQALHAAEKRLIECTKVRNVKDTKHEVAATGILLLASAWSLIAVDVYHHENCYATFTGGDGIRKKN